jgi:flagellar basal body-associated protein FliL
MKSVAPIRKSGESPESADGDEAPGQPLGRKRSAIVVVAAAVFTFAATGGAVFLLSPFGAAEKGGDMLKTPAEEKKKETDSQAHSAVNRDVLKAKSGPKKSKEKKSTKDSEEALTQERALFVVRGDTGIFIPRPIVVTIMPQGRIRYLKVGLAVETSVEAEDAFFDNELRIIDILNGYLRSVPISALEDPTAMVRIREQIARRIRFIVEDAPVDAVLITDFILS